VPDFELTKPVTARVLQNAEETAYRQRIHQEKEDKMKNSLGIDAIVQPRSPAAEEEVGEEDRH
jgi:hypothetical protein